MLRAFLIANRGWLLILLPLVLLLLLHATPFTRWFRPNSDDTLYYYAWLQGWEAIWAMAKGFAIEQGRIGNLLVSPINALGTAGTEYLAGRILFIALHYATYLLFALYFSRLLGVAGWRLPLLLFFVVVAWHPLAYEILPPNTFPLQNNIPFLVVLLARLALLRFPQRQLPSLLGIYLALWLVSVSSEYIIIFLFAILFIEYGGWLYQARQQQPPYEISRRKLLLDSLLLMTLLLSYFAFRLSFPSQYVGNQPGNLLQWQAIAYTTLHHILAGTSFYYLDREILRNLNPTHWGVALLLVGLTAAPAYLLLQRLREELARLPAGMIALAALFFILMATLPLAIVEKYQIWCYTYKSCAYLDSRVAYMALPLLLLALLILGYRHLPGRHLPQIFSALLALLLGVTSALTWLHNQRVSHFMASDMAMWERARELACHPQWQNTPPDLLVKRIDPLNRLPVHTDRMSRESFWPLYLHHRASACPCVVVEQSLVAQIEADYVYGFQNGAYTHFFGSGWSHSDPGGVWSDGTQALFHFRLPYQPLSENVTLLWAVQPHFDALIRQQRVTIQVNGREVTEWHFVADRFDSAQIYTIPLEGHPPGSEITLRFNIQTPKIPGYPPESPDWRALGFAVGYLRLQL